MQVAVGTWRIKTGLDQPIIMAIWARLHRLHALLALLHSLEHLTKAHSALVFEMANENYMEEI